MVPGRRDFTKRTPISVLFASPIAERMASVMLEPGLSGDDADRIIAARPYASKQEIVDRRIVPGQVYRTIADSIVVKK